MLSLCGLCISSILSICTITGSSVIVPDNMQAPVGNIGNVSIDSLSKKDIAFSTIYISRLLISLWMKYLCSWEMMVGDISEGLWLAIVIKTPYFLPSLIISSNVSSLKSFHVSLSLCDSYDRTLVLNLGHSPLYRHFCKCLYIKMLKFYLFVNYFIHFLRSTI